MLLFFYLHLYRIEFTFMNNRLQQFLSLENLTPARLADILGIQRSGLSHILSGRNKPGYDFILKLCTNFPDLNANWFITGKGKPYKDAASSTNHETTAPPYTANSINYGVQKNGNDIIYTKTQQISYQNNNTLKDNNYSKSDLEQNSVDFSKNVSNDLFLFSEESGQPQQNKQYAIDNQYFEPKKTNSYPIENQINEEKQPSARKKRSVKRVIIFYNDGSFDELFPTEDLL